MCNPKDYLRYPITTANWHMWSFDSLSYVSCHYRDFISQPLHILCQTTWAFKVLSKLHYPLLVYKFFPWGVHNPHGICKYIPLLVYIKLYVVFVFPTLEFVFPNTVIFFSPTLTYYACTIIVIPTTITPSLYKKQLRTSVEHMMILA